MTKKPGFIMELITHREDLPKLKLAKARLEKEIINLEAAKINLTEQMEANREYLNRFGNETRQAIYARKVIDEQREKLSDLADYFIDEPRVIPENRNAWKALTKELWREFKRIETWLGGA